MKLIRFYDINWSVDSDENDSNLPSETILELNYSDDESIENIEFDLEECGADYLSDEIGFLVNGFSFEIL